MIHSLDIRDPKLTPIEWLPKVEALAAPRTFEFKEGLNILWGRNGSGKTTVLKLLSRLLHCDQGGRPVVTARSVQELCGAFRGEEVDIKKGIRLKHDGQGVRHFDPSHAVGLEGGMSSFDWDFGSAGIMNAMFKGSAGQTTLFRFEELLGAIMRREVPEVEWKIRRERSNDTYRKWLGIAEHFLAGSGAKGQPTVLLDEPERSYDINAQVGCWRMLRAYAPQTQFIVASHALFALKIPEAHYIGMSPGYLDGSLKALDVLSGWSAERPQPVPLSELPPKTPKKAAPAETGPRRNRLRRPARKEV
jgi:predicted ATPase